MICNYCLKPIEKGQEVFEGSRGTWFWDDQTGHYHAECLEKRRREQKRKRKWWWFVWFPLLILILAFANGVLG